MARRMAKVLPTLPQRADVAAPFHFITIKRGDGFADLHRVRSWSFAGTLTDRRSRRQVGDFMYLTLLSGDVRTANAHLLPATDCRRGRHRSATHWFVERLYKSEVLASAKWDK
jgi:hypothetical protein